ARADDEGAEAAERGRHGVGQGEAEEVDLGVGPQHAEGQDHEPGEGEGRCGGRAGVFENDGREVTGQGCGGCEKGPGRPAQGPGAVGARSGGEWAGPRRIARSRATPAGEPARAGGWSCSVDCMTSTAFGPGNAGRPATASKSTAPAAKMSVRASIGSPRICSG